MNRVYKVLLALPVLLFCTPATSQARADADAPSSYLLEFEISGDFEMKFSVVASGSFTIEAEGLEGDHAFQVLSNGALRDVADDKIELDFEFDASVKSKDGNTVLDVKSKGGAIFKPNQQITLVGWDKSFLKLTAKPIE